MAAAANAAPGLNNWVTHAYGQVMRVLLINDSSTPSGGAEMMSLALRDSLRERGHDAKLFSSRARYDAALTPEADETCFGTTTAFRQVLRMANLSAYWHLRRMLQNYRPDVVHVRMMTTQLSSLILPLLRNYPAIYHGTWHEAICPTGMKMLPDMSTCQMSAGLTCWKQGCVSNAAGPLIAIQYRLLARWRHVFQQVVTNSHYLARQLQAAGWGEPAVIWNGVPEVPPRKPLRGPPTIGFVGRLVPEKGIETVIRALPSLRERLPNLRLNVVGDGPERPMMEQLCRDLKLESSVNMLGALTRDEAERQLQSAWVQVVPSICQESFGLVAAEAQMRGTAVVASRRGGLPEVVVDGQTGSLVEPQNPAQLAEALLPFLTNREWAERVGGAGRVRALQEFSLETCTTKFIELYGRVIDQWQSRSGARPTI